MKQLIALAFGAVALLAAAPAAAPGAAPAATIQIEKVTCGDVMAATPLDRSAIVMFYWGYAAAKARATQFKTGALRTATHALVAECQESPSETVLDAMKRVDAKAF